MEVWPNLFGRTLLVRQWGRIGSEGHRRSIPIPIQAQPPSTPSPGWSSGNGGAAIGTAPHDQACHPQAGPEDGRHPRQPRWLFTLPTAHSHRAEAAARRRFDCRRAMKRIFRPARLLPARARVVAVLLGHVARRRAGAGRWCGFPAPARGWTVLFYRETALVSGFRARAATDLPTHHRP